MSKPHVWPAWLKFSQYVHNVSAQMYIYFWHISVYLCPKEYIYDKMSILMSIGSGFLWVIRVLQAVGPQIRAVGPRKWSGCSNFSIISVI